MAATGFELEDVTKFMDFRVFESALGSKGHPNLEIDIFHISYTSFVYPFLFPFCISCLDQPGIRETRMQLENVTQFMDF